jgi:uncharacterized protein (TIRG00374 family)
LIKRQKIGRLGKLKAKPVEGFSWRRQRLLGGIVFIVILAGAILIFWDWKSIKDVLAQADWKPLPWAFLLTFISYACISYSFARVSKLLKIRMGVKSLSEIGFISTSINHVLLSGGIAGYSVRFLFMGRHGVQVEEVIAVSVLHFYLTSLMMLGMLPFGFIYLLFNAAGKVGATIAFGVLSALLFLVFILATLILLNPSARARLLGFAGKIVQKVTRRNIRGDLEQLDDALARGLKAMQKEPAALATILLLIIVDWIASMLTLGVCFLALGPGVHLGALMAGYVIGVMAGVLSMIPGGLGVQEGSMAGVFALLGASFEQALLASILYRAIYFLLPFLISLAFYGNLLREPTSEA